MNSSDKKIPPAPCPYRFLQVLAWFALGLAGGFFVASLATKWSLLIMISMALLWLSVAFYVVHLIVKKLTGEPRGLEKTRLETFLHKEK